MRKWAAQTIYVWGRIFLDSERLNRLAQTHEGMESLIGERPLGAGIEDARLFSTRLQVRDCQERRPAALEELTSVLALFARARARQEAEAAVPKMT